MFDRHGNLKVTLGTPGEKGSNLDPLQFDQVSDVAFSSTGDMFVVDGDDGINHRLLKLSADHQLLWSVGEEGAGPGQFRVPHSVGVDRFGQVWVADRRNRRLQVFSGQTGSYIGEWTLNEDVYAVRSAANGARTGHSRRERDEEMMMKHGEGQLVHLSGAETTTIQVMVTSG
ncbi:NHLRC3 [Branchiostoma lanceolatum]|uniref:NHLRC3 protein n=1 Tax=Branchiostoma lanceolatum TaxID=7740 RepID=A0A8J9Z2U8_BRALA|nr:NHLRC3 [Branchiostoma lanceolatum]